jgi:hypothetical protein
VSIGLDLAFALVGIDSQILVCRLSNCNLHEQVKLTCHGPLVDVPVTPCHRYYKFYDFVSDKWWLSTGTKCIR